jgi:hypothetical protein
MLCLGISVKIAFQSRPLYESLSVRYLSNLLLFRHQVSKSLSKPCVRSRQNEARTMMYVVKRCCDRTLPEIAEHFENQRYATVSWNCRVVESKMAKETKFKDRIEKFAASI